MNTPKDLTSYVRVLKLASTPSWDEFSKVSTIAGLGILLVETFENSSHEGVLASFSTRT